MLQQLCLTFQDANGGSMPAYFRFLTILAFHVFLQEKVSNITDQYCLYIYTFYYDN